MHEWHAVDPGSDSGWPMNVTMKDFNAFCFRINGFGQKPLSLSLWPKPLSLSLLFIISWMFNTAAWEITMLKITASIKKMQQNGQANPNICHAGHSSLWAHSKWFAPKSLPFIYAGCERCHNLSNKYDPLILIKLPTDGYFRWGMAHPHLKCCCAILISELKSISKE